MDSKSEDSGSFSVSLQGSDLIDASEDEILGTTVTGKASSSIKNFSDKISSATIEKGVKRDENNSFSDHFILHHRGIVTLHTNSGGYSDKPREQDMVNCTNQYDPIAGTIIKDEDVIVKASYLGFASTFRFSYGKVSNLNLNKEEKLIKVLNGFKPKSKLYLQGNGVQVISPVGQKGTQKLTFGSHAVYELNESGTQVDVQKFEAAPESKTSLVFFEKEENQDTPRKLFEVDIKFHKYHCSFPVVCNSKPPKLTRHADGYLIDAESRELMTAQIDNKKHWAEFLELQKGDPMLYESMKVNLELSNFTPKFKKMETCNFVESLKLQLEDRTLHSFQIPFVEKLPLLKKIQISGKKFSSPMFQRTFWLLDGLTDQPNVLSHLSQVGTNLLSSCFNFEHLHALTVSDLQIKFKSWEEIDNFRGNVDNISFSREKFKLEMTNCNISIAADRNATLKFLLLLTCDISESTVKELLEVSAAIEQTTTDVNRLSMTFLKGRVVKIKIATNICVDSFDGVLKLCKLWKLRKTDSFDFEELSLKYNDLNYSWVLLLNNMNIRDNSFFKHLEQFKFNRENMRGILGAISDIELEEVPMTISIKKIVVEVALSDSRGEVCKLITSLVECLQKFFIKIHTLKIEIECDESGWGFFKFNLTEMKTKLKFDDVTITFPRNSTDDTRLVSVEVHRFPTHLIEEMNVKKGTNTAVSPLVCIDQKMDTPFLQPISVFFPYPEESIGGKIKVRVFSKIPPNKWQWQQVHDDMTICAISWYRKKKLCYQSTHFCPVVSFFDSGDSSSSPPSPPDAMTPYFANSVFVTIHPLVTRKGNVVFDCVDERDEDKQATLKLSDYFEKRKVGQMKKNEKILAYFDGNLVVKAPKLEHGDKMLFYCPKQERNRNKQEYQMKKIDDKGDWRGFIHYYLKSGENEEKLFHQGYHIPIESMKSMDLDQNLEHTFQHSIADRKKKFLEKALFKLSTDLHNSELICAYMISAEEMTPLKSDEIHSETTSVKTNLKLVRYVMAHGPRAYDKFREALIELKEPKHLIDALPSLNDVICPNIVGDSCISVTSLETGEDINDAGPSTLDSRN